MFGIFINLSKCLSNYILEQSLKDLFLKNNLLLHKGQKLVDVYNYYLVMLINLKYKRIKIKFIFLIN